MPLAPPVQLLIQNTNRLEIECFKADGIATNTIVIPVSPILGCKGSKKLAIDALSFFRGTWVTPISFPRGTSLQPKIYHGLYTIKKLSTPKPEIFMVLLPIS
ncbi:MAG: hypothetical protein BA861_12765 [Desulfobacterales bacterium S3730MH5]|nr:MAG: hypothetical protein BA861_12765 [Desulfobacterales bacterium S3730MH5]